ncbi:hypothetical protein [Thermosyntropha lipolytica]|uniref:hypothetical protein n=1 Tax=Thermosyntropha lipolytica TaxID=54294 RepID=UPI001160D83D|nr:hypothetical protein [Thermosyntropha lipolytica]
MPKQILRGIVEDIKKFIDDNEGRLIILEVAKEIPPDLKKQLLEELALFYDEDLAVFFRLFLEEYEEEFKPVCMRALNKYRMAGYDIDAISFQEGVFHKAYASLSRESGSVSLEVAWKKGGRYVDIEYFYLSYGLEGIHSFALVSDMPIRRYDADRRQVSDMVKLDWEEVCLLIQKAYEVNRKNMISPPTGRFIYKKYLEAEVKAEEEKIYDLTLKLCSDLLPGQLINSFFYALKQKDYIYIASLLDRSRLALTDIKDLFAGVLKPGHLLLEAKADTVSRKEDGALVNGHLCLLEREGVYKYNYVFRINQSEDLRWKLFDVKLVAKSSMPAYHNWEPDKKGFFCSVYDIADIDGLFVWLEEIRLLKVVGEIPRGIHLRISPLYDQDEWYNGVSFLGPGEVDLVINGDELVVVCLDADFLADLDEEIANELGEAVELKGRYEVDLLAVYSYIEGQYTFFEDVARSKDEEETSLGGVRFLSARYLVKNYARVYDFLALTGDCFYPLPDYTIFYRLEKDGEEDLFGAEYILDKEYLTVSAFGEDDLRCRRDELSIKLCDDLEFMGMEIRREGIFAVLTSEVRRFYPGLEAVLKELYLNKWLKSRLPVLKGMTPGEAFQSREGQILLWDMFKQMKRSENSLQKKACKVKFKDYINKLENRYQKIK